MELKDILKLMEAFSESNIHEIKLEQEAFKIKLEKEPVKKEVVVTESKPQTRVLTETKQVTSTPADEHTQTEKEDNFHIIKSPIVGTFYSSPSPDAKNYVEVGSQVKKGQVLCIIEAMKLMNDIESDFDGEVVEILVKNEQMVEYGQPLFKIK
jgi:acetyl-CoA carboxylase biotin carboxyl carrier protein